MNLFAEVEAQERRSQYPAPTVQACSPLYSSFVERFHVAMMAGDTAAAMAAQQAAHDLVKFLHDELEVADKASGLGYARLCFSDLDKQLQEATAPEEGAAPLWGQAGVFTTTVAGVPVRVEIDGFLGINHRGSLLPHFSIHVVEPLRLFFSSTGYRSFFSGLPEAVAGLTLEQAVCSSILAYFRAKRSHGGMEGKLEALRHEYQDRAMGRELDRSEYDHQGNRKGSPEFAKAALELEKLRAKYANGPAMEEEEEEDDVDGGGYDGEEDGLCECGRVREACTTFEDEDAPHGDLDDAAMIAAELGTDGTAEEEEEYQQCPNPFECATCGAGLRGKRAFTQSCKPRERQCQECYWTHREEHGCEVCGVVLSVDETERIIALREAKAVEVTATLHTPLPSVSKVTGDIEKHSPLFRETLANPQLSLF